MKMILRASARNKWTSNGARSRIRKIVELHRLQQLPTIPCQHHARLAYRTRLECTIRIANDDRVGYHWATRVRVECALVRRVDLFIGEDCFRFDARGGMIEHGQLTKLQ